MAALASLRRFPVSVSSNVKYCSCSNDQRKCILVHMFMKTAGDGYRIFFSKGGGGNVEVECKC